MLFMTHIAPVLKALRLICYLHALNLQDNDQNPRMRSDSDELLLYMAMWQTTEQNQKTKPTYEYKIKNNIKD